MAPVKVLMPGQFWQLRPSGSGRLWGSWAGSVVVLVVGMGVVGPVSFCPLRGLSPASEGQRHPTCAPWMPLPWLGGRAWQVRFLPWEDS